MKDFKDLDFDTHPNTDLSFDKQAVEMFTNGYGVSVINGRMAYCTDDTYEVAIIYTDGEDGWDLCYNTDITDDVIGDQTEQDITNIMRRVQELKD